MLTFHLIGRTDSLVEKRKKLRISLLECRNKSGIDSFKENLQQEAKELLQIPSKNLCIKMLYENN